MDVFKQIKEIQENIFRSKKESAAAAADPRGIKSKLGKNTMSGVEGSTPTKNE